MNLSMMSTAGTTVGLTVNRTTADAGSGYAVQVLLGSAYNALYLSVDEARHLGQQLLAVTDDETAEVQA